MTSIDDNEEGDDYVGQPAETIGVNVETKVELLGDLRKSYRKKQHILDRRMK